MQQQNTIKIEQNGIITLQKEELLRGLWKWARSVFIKEIPEAETSADDPQIQEKIQYKLLALIEDENSYTIKIKGRKPPLIL